jgi:hypothetical protein
VTIRRTCFPIGLALILALAACGSPGKTPTTTPSPSPSFTPTWGPSPTPTWTPFPTRTPGPSPTSVWATAPSTWTPSPTVPTATPPSYTPAPTVTARPTLTSTPGVTSGVVRQDTQLIVTVLDSDLDTAIASVFYALDSRPTTMPPVVTLDYGGRVQIEMAFYNSFLNRNSQVIVQARLSAADGQIAVEEQRDRRAVTGGLVADSSIRSGLALVTEGITRALTTLAGPLPGSYRLHSITVYPDHVRAVFVEEVPAG